MVTLEQLKEDLRIDFDQDDAILQRNLDAAVSIIERYTGISISEKTLEFTGRDRPFKLYDVYPIDSIDGATFEDCGPYYVITPDDSGFISIEVGDEDIPALNKAALRVASDLYENIEIRETTLPIDVQMMVNKFRRGGFLS